MKIQKKFLTMLAVPVFAAAAVAADAECKDGVCPVPANAEEVKADAVKTDAKTADAAKCDAVKADAKAADAAKADAVKADSVDAAKAAAKAAAADAVNEVKPAAVPGAKTFEEALAFLPDTVAVINGKELTKKEVIETMQKNIPQQFVAQLMQNMTKEQFKQMVNGMIEERIFMEILAQDGYTPSVDRVKKVFKEKFNEQPDAMKKQVEAQLKIQGKTLDQYIDELAANESIQMQAAEAAYVDEKILPEVKITDEEVLKFYNDNKDKIPAREASITASHILIMPAKDAPDAAKADAEAKAKAEAVLAQLKQGADFAEVAKKESGCPSKDQGGKLGTMSQNQLDQDFWKAAYALDKGGMSGVVKTQFGYHIIKLEDKKEGAVPTFEEIAPALRENLKNRKVAEILKEKVDAFKKTGKVKISEF